jgi:hypothetical protein
MGQQAERPPANVTLTAIFSSWARLLSPIEWSIELEPVEPVLGGIVHSPKRHDSTVADGDRLGAPRVGAISDGIDLDDSPSRAFEASVLAAVGQAMGVPLVILQFPRHEPVHLLLDLGDRGFIWRPVAANPSGKSREHGVRSSVV